MSGNQGLAEQVVSEMASNPLTTFVTLLAQEQEQQQSRQAQEDGADSKKDKEAGPEVPIDDVQCRP